MAATVYRFGDFMLDTAERRLLDAGRPVRLNARYFDVLVLLVSEQGRLIGKDRFFDVVWKGVVVGDEALTQCMKTLRRVLRDDATEPRFIETVPKFGYRFVASVTEEAPRRPSPMKLQNFSSSLVTWLQVMHAGLGGAVAGATAGLVGGLFYGYAVALAPGIDTPGAALVLLVITALSALVGGLGALGVSLGLALGAIGQQPWWVVAGAALGGLVVGGLSNLFGLDAFALLLGVTPDQITGAAEGAAIGAAVGLGWMYGGSPKRVILRMAVTCAMTGLLVVLSSGTMMAGSLDSLGAALAAAELPIERLEPFLPTGRLALGVELLLGGLEGLVFGTGLGAGLSLVARGSPLLTQSSPTDHGTTGLTALTFAPALSAWRQMMTAEAQSGWVRRHRWRIARWSAAAGLLLAPYIAMQFTGEVNWEFDDFFIFGAMLTGFGLLFEVSLNWSKSFSYRAAMALALGTGFLLIWVVLAVGLIGHEGNTFNLLYVGVLSIGAFGAALARFEPEGMGRALFATAAAQVLAAGVALAVGAGLIHSATVLRLLAATAVFTSLWLLSAGLFRRAAREGVRL